MECSWAGRGGGTARQLRLACCGGAGVCGWTDGPLRRSCGPAAPLVCMALRLGRPLPLSLQSEQEFGPRDWEPADGPGWSGSQPGETERQMEGTAEHVVDIDTANRVEIQQDGTMVVVTPGLADGSKGTLDQGRRSSLQILACFLVPEGRYHA
ncbi:hypothetical protein NDU88_005663 [Pleurodeles waltl]|uniref:Uncharacterized protein n=1 Tax=Pleurodeles waltl TaxID=8319 RepID=A0AAV7UJD1_PLEWA|nr:hypothetical protein NDU88_005663 [Pleurodeles waltl]